METDQRKGLHQKIKDVFFDSSKKVISLNSNREEPIKEKNKWLIDISPEHIKNILKHDFTAFCYIVVLIVGLILLSSSFKAKAETAVFYPYSCLGSWVSTDRASGTPEIRGDINGSDFTTENSAVLRDSNGQIYCGNFTGEVPKDTEPKKFYVSFSWFVDTNSQKDGGEILIPLNPEINSLDQILPSSQTETNPEPAPTDDSASPVVEDSPVSFNYFKANIAYADDEVSAPDSTDIADPIIAPSLENSEATPNTLLRILYTLDGVTWLPLGEVNNSNWRGAKFEIPLTSWDDISKMQISLERIDTYDKTPSIYLDGMKIDVEYEHTQGIVSPSSFHISSMKSNDPTLALSVGGHPPEREDVSVSSAAGLANLAVYNSDIGALLLDTHVGAGNYILDPEYLGSGNFTLINTNDPNICENKNLDECMAAEDFISSGVFSIGSK
jgi:hypothetical protein